MLQGLSQTSFRALSSTRTFSTSRPTWQAVALASDAYAPKASTGSGPLVILHGLYGSKQNWRSLAKAMADRLGKEVIALDLRNHGASPHAVEAAYTDLAGDVGEYLDKRGLKDVTLMGHSMGGKVAMALALSPHAALERLIVVDMAPGVGQISPEFSNYLDGMAEIDAARCTSRKDADAILALVEPDLGVRQFLLTNLERAGPSDPYKFRLPLKILRDALGEIGQFPYSPEERQWDRPALFIKGAKSKYINRKNIPLIEAYFPQMILKTLDAGHWVHAEQPKEFIDEVADFCK